MDSTASPPPTKIARLRPRQSLCEYSAYQCDRPCYLRTRFCDAHICEMQTLRSVGTSSSHEPDGGGGGGSGTTPGIKGGNSSSQQQQPTVIQCQYRVRRYERRCKNPVPSDGGDVHFCSEHRARVATRRDGSSSVTGSASNPGAAAEAALKEALSNASGSAPTTVSPAAVAEAVVSDYVRLPQLWLSSTRRPADGGPEALYGLPPVPGSGLQMPRAKDDRGEWKEDWDSDAESPASDDEDKLESIRNAGVYTVNEMLIHAMFHRRKLMLLYQEHMAAMRRILQHEHAVYEEVRNNHKQMRTATNTIIMRGRQAEIFRALRKFKRYSGVESLVHDKSKRIRLRSVCPDKLKPSANPQRCAYNDPTKDEKCPERVLPLSKYCPKHILHQANQCLFDRCLIDRCDQPVLRVTKEEPKEDGSGEPRTDPEKLCSTHRPAESLSEWLPPDVPRSGLVSQLSGRASPPRPPPEAVTAAKLAAAAPLISPEKAEVGAGGERLLLKREDSMSLQEPFEFNLFMMNEEEMLDPKLMEEALSVLHHSDGLEPSPNTTMVVGAGSSGAQPVASGSVACVPVSGPSVVPGGAAWTQHMEDFVDVVLRDSRNAAVGEGAVGEGAVGAGVVSGAGDLHMGELWPGDLDRLSEVWEGLVAADAAIEHRDVGEGAVADVDVTAEEIVEVEVEQVDLEAPGHCAAVLAELQALDQAASTQTSAQGASEEYPVGDEPPVIVTTHASIASTTSISVAVPISTANIVRHAVEAVLPPVVSIAAGDLHEIAGHSSNEPPDISHQTSEIRPEMSDQINEERLEMSLHMIEERPEIVRPLSEERDEIVRPLSEERDEITRPSSEERPEMSHHMSEERSVIVQSLSEERPEIVRSLSEERPEIVRPLSEERPSSEERSEILQPSIEEQSEIPQPSSKGQEEIVQHFIEEQREIVRPACNEPAEIARPTIEEQPAIVRISSIEQQEVIRTASEEQSKIVPSSDEQPQIVPSSNEEQSEIVQSSNDAEPDVVQFSSDSGTETPQPSGHDQPKTLQTSNVERPAFIRSCLDESPL